MKDAIRELTEAVRALTRAYEAASKPVATKKTDAPQGEFKATIEKLLFAWKNGNGRTYRVASDTAVDFGDGKQSKYFNLFVSDKHMVAFDEGERISFSISKAEVGEYNDKPTYSVFVSAISPLSPVSGKADEGITIEGNNNNEQDEDVPF